LLLYDARVSTSIAVNPLHGAKVLIVSSDDETVDGTRKYLNRMGASAESVTNLAAAFDLAVRAGAVVLFADGYSKQSAVEAVRRWRRQLNARVVVVSDQVESFVSIGADEPTGAVTVLHRPTWAWMLLDAIRSQLASPEGREP
jgi:DNA-binding response OmpR family regulator